MSGAPQKSRLLELRQKYQGRYDAVSMLVYLSVVYVWSLWIYPLGRDYALLSGIHERPPLVVELLIECEAACFQDRLIAYHVTNLALLYASMLLLYRVTNLTLRGPSWMGTLAATLFMANPAYSEATLNLCGIVDLLPCVSALAALLAYMIHTRAPSAAKRELSVALFVVAVVLFPQNAGLILVLLLYEALVLKENSRSYLRLVPHLIVSLMGLVVYRDVLWTTGLAVTDTFAPLYFLFYPIGFLPENAKDFHDKPWLAWLGAVTTMVILYLIQRKSRSRALLFGLLSMGAIRLLQPKAMVDPVHLVGGGQLVLPGAFYALVLSALFLRIMDHPKWRRTVIFVTTVLCLVFFGMGIRANFAWRHAGHAVQQFQQQVYDEQRRNPDRPLGILPDYQYYLGAPLRLSQAVAYETPFSRSVLTVPLLPLHYERPPRLELTVMDWSSAGGTLLIRGQAPVALVCWPYALTTRDARQVFEHCVARVEEVRPDGFSLRVEPKESPLPERLLTFAENSAREEAGDNTE
ncbi:MAG: hypothetical protein HY706_14655 [Candidatus Hydrogenedentes bacterium]|nr:hypothetical protein [Candidatus Hydrogenedentota bacterium]